MRALRSTPLSRMHRRLCLTCGYDGQQLQSLRPDIPHTDTLCYCPNCGEDLYARPPRSYAELEGLDEEDDVALLARRLTAPLARPTRLARLLTRLKRWLRPRF